MPSYVDRAGPSPALSLLTGTPATLQLDELDGMLAVYLADSAADHRDELARVIATLNRTTVGAALLDDLRKLARAGAISTVEWHPERSPLPPGTWFYRRDGAQYEAILSPETDLRRHAGLVFRGLAEARNALMEKLRWSGKPLKVDELQGRLNRQLGELRKVDTTTEDFDGLLTAHVASGMSEARAFVQRHLTAIGELPEGRNLLQQFATLREMGAMPVVDWGSRQMDELLEPDGIPVWCPAMRGNDAIALKTLAAVRDALVKVVAGLQHTSEARIEKALGAARAATRKDTLDGILTMHLTQAAEAVRSDVVGDLRRIQRTGIGNWLIAELQAHAKAGRMIVLDNGPITGPASIGGKPVWVYGKRLLEARGQDLLAVTPEQGRLCAAFTDLLTLANAAAEKHAARPVPLPVTSLQRLFRDELLDLDRTARVDAVVEAAVDAPAGLPAARKEADGTGLGIGQAGGQRGQDPAHQGGGHPQGSPPRQPPPLPAKPSRLPSTRSRPGAAAAPNAANGHRGDATTVLQQSLRDIHPPRHEPLRGEHGPDTAGRGKPTPLPRSPRMGLPPDKDTVDLTAATAAAIAAKALRR